MCVSFDMQMICNYILKRVLLIYLKQLRKKIATFVLSWTNKFGLSFNPSKCQAIIVGSNCLMSRLNIKRNATDYVSWFVPACMCLYVDTTLNWQAKATYVSQSITGTFRFLYRLKKFLPRPR